MRIASPYCVFDLPDGFVEQPSESCASFVREAGRFEITISTFVQQQASEHETVAVLDDALRRLSEHHKTALSTSGAAPSHVTPIVFEYAIDEWLRSWPSGKIR
jgi:hypothetical protein